MNLTPRPPAHAKTLPFVIMLVTLAFAPSRAQDAESKILFDPAQPGAAELITPNETFGDTTFAVQDGAVVVTVKAGGTSSYPGIVITPTTAWDTAACGHVEATVSNTGTRRIRFNLRIDNEGPWQNNPWSAEVSGLNPGETKTVSVIFGYSHGKQGYALDPGAIVRAILFIGKSDVEQSFRITALRAAGPVGETPYVDPNTQALKPAEGVLLGGAAGFDASKQLAAKSGAKVIDSDGQSFTVAFAAQGQPSLLFKPVAGMWNLNEHLQLRVRVRNAGQTPVTPRVQLLSRGGPSDAVSASGPLAPGAETELVLPFMAAIPWKGQDLPEMNDLNVPVRAFDAPQPGTGMKYTSNSTTGIELSAGDSPTATVQILSIVADMPPQQPLPDWLGKRPPVEGDWKLSFEDNFDGTAIDLKTWNIYTPGDWHIGSATSFSKDDVIVRNGKLALRLEKRRVHHNDNPENPMRDYATGWADSYGKWTQRYGYFEARLKLPTTPNSFTAFWLMPDRGIAFDPKAAGYVQGYPLMRNDTKAGGMEFDIMEQLSIWGPNRHDFGMHWDGYMKYHKSIGVFTCYYPPDEEGFLTVGLLWTPGVAVMYQQGREAARWETPRMGSLPSYMLLQHVSGGWETEGFDDAHLPADLVFDYVRVWQRADLASAADGSKPNDGGPLPPAK